MDPAHEQRTIKADRRARIVLAVCAVVPFLGVPVATWLMPRGQSYLEGQAPHVSLRILPGLLAVILLSFLPIGGYLFWFGRRVVRSRQMPPPGTWVIRETRVIEGDGAVKRGQAMMALATILSAVVLLGSLWLPCKLGKAFAAGSRHSAGQAGPTDGNQPSVSPTP